MRTARPQEVVIGQATGVARVKVGPCKAACSSVHAAPLRVVEDVERLRAKLEAGVLTNLEMLKQAHVEVGALRIVQHVASRGPKRQTLRCGKCRWIEEQRSNNTLHAWNIGNSVRIADDVQIRTGSRSISHARVE